MIKTMSWASWLSDHHDFPQRIEPCFSHGVIYCHWCLRETPRTFNFFPWGCTWVHPQVQLIHPSVQYSNRLLPTMAPGSPRGVMTLSLVEVASSRLGTGTETLGRRETSKPAAGAHSKMALQWQKNLRSETASKTTWSEKNNVDMMSYTEFSSDAQQDDKTTEGLRFLLSLMPRGWPSWRLRLTTRPGVLGVHAHVWRRYGRSTQDGDWFYCSLADLRRGGISRKNR